MEEGGKYKCPSCGCQLSSSKDVFFQGQHVLADITCTCCDVEYYQTISIGHGALFPVSFTKDFSKTRYSPEVKGWWALPLIQSMESQETFLPVIEIVITRKVEKIVWLNCLDTCYGHVFQRLLNVQAYLDLPPEFGVVVVIPEGFTWMVPEGIAEVWVVKTPLFYLNKKITGFDAFVKEEFTRFQEVKLSKAHIQPDASKIDWVLFLKQARFDLTQFNKLPYLVTFVWREDRFWHATFSEEVLWLASRKFKFFKLIKWFFVWRQMIHISSVARKIKRKLGKTEFAILGLGHSGKASPSIADHRIPGTNSFGKETEWFPLLAKTHVTLGVLGSSMLIPTALAASFVDIVPTRMLSLLGEDIAQPYSDRSSHFLGRFVYGTPSSRQVANQVISILQGYERYSQNFPEHES